MFSACVALGFLLLSGTAVAQQYTISTFAGGGLPVNLPGTSASIGQPQAVAADPSGNLFFVRQGEVLRLDATSGILTLLAGNPTIGFSGDNGPATSAQLGGPRGVAVDSTGNVYIADAPNYRIRKVSNGVITTVAGNGTQGFSGDNGPATSAQLHYPAGVAVDSAGNIYVADLFRVRKVSNGVITTVAGNGTQGFSGDNGPATSAQVGPAGIAVDSSGNLYFADVGNQRIRKVSDGVITTVAGNGTFGFSGDNGPATSAQFFDPTGIALDSSANLYIADSLNNRIRKVSNGVITTVAGDGTFSYSGDNGPATSAQLSLSAFGLFSFLTLDPGGNLYIADLGNFRVRKVSSGVITAVAGNGTFGFSGDNGPAIKAQLAGPAGVAADSVGNVYIAGIYDYRIRKVSNGVIATVAGGGSSLGDSGPATSAQLYDPAGVAVDSAGNLYIADRTRVRKVSNGVITTVAGNGTAGFSGDNGPATSASLSATGLAVDSIGNLYIADSGNNRIRKVSNGVITTVAGDGTDGSYGNNVPAITARFSSPRGVAVDSAGNLYIADTGNRLIRKITNGVVTTIAGNGVPDFAGDNGPATSAALNQPCGIAVDSVGNVYIADSLNNRIRLLTPSGIVPTSLSITAVDNGASNLPGPISPGEIVVLYGSGLGPARISEGHVGDDGLFGTQLAGTSVSFNGISARMIYTWATQVAAVVPYGITGSTAQVTVTYQGQTTAALSVPIASSAPGIFTSDSTGKGQAAAVNQDNSLNTAGTPAKIGDVISLYATGEGQTTPGGTDGKPATVPLPKPNLPVSVTIGGLPAQLQYFGGAPGEIAGLMQINAVVPSGIQTGNVPVVLQVGNLSSQAGVTIAVR